VGGETPPSVSKNIYIFGFQYIIYIENFAAPKIVGGEAGGEAEKEKEMEMG